MKRFLTLLIFSLATFLNGNSIYNAPLEQVFTKLEEKISKKKIEEKTILKYYNVRYFRKTWEEYLKHHRDALYSDDLSSGPGTATRDNMEGTVECLKRKQIKELEFILKEKVNPEDLSEAVQIWLGDAEFYLWKNFKDFLLVDNKFSLMVQNIIEHFKINLDDIKRLDSSPEDEFWFSNPFGNQYMHEIFKKYAQPVFSEDEIALFQSLEAKISDAYLKILHDFRYRPSAMAYISRGHISWLEYKNALLKMYGFIGIPIDYIKIRLLCYYLSRIYFYKHFSQYFISFNYEKRCLVFPPREYFDIYDCTIVRSQKKLTPIESSPCFPCVNKSFGGQ